MQPPEALQIEEAPQDVPSGRGTAPSTQTDDPLSQEVVAAKQEPGFWQAAPATQAMHAPPLQTWFVPQTVPFGSVVGESTQTEVPVAQEVVPVWQASGFVSQATPAVHATQLPALQTWSVPHVVPFASGVAVSRQLSPVAQDVVPARQVLGLVVQAAPGVHAVHTPPSQTWFVPQTVPSATGVPVSSHTEEPVSHEVRWTVHAFVGVHSTPATQAVHAPPLQT
jgi:hypothetical protein